MGASETPRGRQREAAARKAGQDVPNTSVFVVGEIGTGNNYESVWRIFLWINKLQLDLNLGHMIN